MSSSRIVGSGGVGWVASLMKQLLQEVRVTPVGVADRTRIAEIHERSVTRVERRFSRDVVNELEGLPVPFCGQERKHIGPGPEPDRHLSRIDRLLDNIETSQFGQQRQRQRQRQRRAGAARSRGATNPALRAPGGTTQTAADHPRDDSLPDDPSGDQG